MNKTAIFYISLILTFGIAAAGVSGTENKNIKETLNAELVKAAKSGNLIKYTGYLREGANFNKAVGDIGENTLNIAAAKGHLPIVQFIIEKRKIDVNIKSGEYKMPPLFMAASKNHLAVVKYLIRKGANVNLKNRMRSTPIFEPAGKGYLAVVKYLVSKGADVNIADRYGLTPLHLAARENRFAMVKYLIQKGANPSAKNLVENKIPADFAHGRVKRFLLNRNKNNQD